MRLSTLLGPDLQAVLDKDPDAIAEALLERETIGTEETDAIMEGRELPPSHRVVIPTYADKRKKDDDRKKGSIFQPRPNPEPSAG